jgi:hypothetical protein
MQLTQQDSGFDSDVILLHFLCLNLSKAHAGRLQAGPNPVCKAAGSCSTIIIVLKACVRRTDMLPSGPTAGSKLRQARTLLAN